MEIIQGDANVEIARLVGATDWTNKRAVIFLDPYGMDVAWSTLVEIQATHAIDVWYLVSMEGIFRQAPRDSGKLTAEKRHALNRMLGTSDWEQEWYTRKERSLFNDMNEGHVRKADLDEIERFVARRLRSLFETVLPPKRLKSDGGVHSFSLFLAISSRQPAAIRLATRIGNHILKSRA